MAVTLKLSFVSFPGNGVNGDRRCNYSYVNSLKVSNAWDVVEHLI